MTQIRMDITKTLDSDELKYLIRKLTKIQGFEFDLHFICSHLDIKYHPPKPKVMK